MIYTLLCIIIAWLIVHHVIYARGLRRQRETIQSLKSAVKYAEQDRDKMFAEYNDLKARIVDKAQPKVVNHIPKRYTGAQIRIMNDRLNAKQSAELQERPNSEILKETANG